MLNQKAKHLQNFLVILTICTLFITITPISQAQAATPEEICTENTIQKPLIIPVLQYETIYGPNKYYGINFSSQTPSDVQAATAGTILKTSTDKWGGGYGKYVLIDHGNGLKTMYGYLGSINVKIGDTVTQGQTIGTMGATGYALNKTGSHLHFEVLQNQKKLPPLNYIRQAL